MLQFFVKLWRNHMSEHWEDGFDAYHEGYALVDNPHVEGTYAYAEWRKGWNEASKTAI